MSLEDGRSFLSSWYVMLTDSDILQRLDEIARRTNEGSAAYGLFCEFATSAERLMLLVSRYGSSNSRTFVASLARCLHEKAAVDPEVFRQSSAIAIAFFQIITCTEAEIAITLLDSMHSLPREMRRKDLDTLRRVLWRCLTDTGPKAELLQCEVVEIVALLVRMQVLNRVFPPGDIDELGKQLLRIKRSSACVDVVELDAALTHIRQFCSGPFDVEDERKP